MLATINPADPSVAKAISASHALWASTSLKKEFPMRKSARAATITPSRSARFAATR
jgi:hypothetical protein